MARISGPFLSMIVSLLLGLYAVGANYCYLLILVVIDIGILSGRCAVCFMVIYRVATYR